MRLPSFWARPGHLTGLTWIVSAGLHLAAVSALFAMDARRSERPKETIIRMTVEEKAPPKPKVVPPKPAPEPTPKPKRQRVVPKRDIPLTPPPPSSKVEKPLSKPVRPIFGVSMSSTVSGGNGTSMAVQVGNTLAMAPQKAKVKPEDVVPYSAPVTIRPRPQVVPTSKLTRMPQPRRLVKARFPEEARAAGIEGDTILKLWISTKGEVVRVEIIKGIGHGLDRLAAEAAKKFTFEPAMIDDEAVATVIPFTYRWEIED